MKFNTDNYQDIAKYFKHSYVKFPVTGEFLCTIDKVEPTHIIGKVFVPTSAGTWEAQDYQQDITGDGVELEFIMPRKSFFNYNGNACLLTRIPARQYKKGITTENTTISKLTASGGFNMQELDFQLLNAYVAKQAFSAFGSADKSYAVSPRMAVTSKGSIFVDSTQIGVYDKKTSSAQVYNELFRSEVERVAVQHGQSLSVSLVMPPKPEPETEDDWEPDESEEDEE